MFSFALEIIEKEALRKKEEAVSLSEQRYHAYRGSPWEYSDHEGLQHMLSQLV
jgi:hypothetical protein